MKEMIDGHLTDLNLSNGGRLSLKEQFSNLERKYAHAVDSMTRELRDINFRNQRKKRLLGANFLIEKIIHISQERQESALIDLKAYAHV